MEPTPLGGVLNIEFSLQEVRITFFYLLFFSVTLYALFKGSAPERSVAAAYFSTWLLGKFVHLFVSFEYAKMDGWLFILDFALWIGLLAIALRAERFWPLCIVALHSITMVAHMTKAMDVSIVPRAYFIMQVFWSYPGLITLAIGVYCHQCRVKANGVDPSWRSF